MRRKLFDSTVCLIVGVLLGYYFSAVQSLFLLLTGCVILASGIYRSRKITERLFMLLFCLLGLILMLTADLDDQRGTYHDQSMIDGQAATITGKVIDIRHIDEETYQFTLKQGHEKLLCSYYAHLDQPWALLGCNISFCGKIERPSSAGNPRCFDYRLYLRSQGIGYVTSTDCFETDGRKGDMTFRIQSQILVRRDRFLQAMHSSSTSKGVLRGILFGDTGRMDEEIYTLFRQNGTAHVLAVSGLHIGMLYSLYRSLYQRFHRRWISILFLLLLMLYGTATLWSVSVTRAVMLICLTMAGDILHRRYDLLTALTAAALVSIVRNPYIIFAAGFQMSFLAVASIVFLQTPMEWLCGKRMATSMAVQIGLMPYMAFVFNYISIVGIFCNIPVVFLASLLVPLGMAAFMGYFLFEFTIPLLDRLLGGMADLLVFVNALFSADGRLSFDVASPPLWTMILVYGVMFYGASEQARILFGRKKWKQALKSVGVILLGTVLAFGLGRSSFDHADLIFVDVGQGDCIHIKASDGLNVLVDGGGNIRYNVGEKTLKPYLLKNGFSRVDLAAATHLHTDHYLGLTELAECFDVRAMLTSGKAGDIVRLGDESWMEILWPLTEDPETEDENLNSLIFMVHQNGVKTLITGDITAEGEAMLINQYRGTEKLRADILNPLLAI